MLKHSLLCASLALCALAAPLIPAHAEPVTKEALGGLVREYLLANPEVIIEAVQTFQQREEQANAEKTKVVIQEQRAKIYDNPAHGSFGEKTAKVAVVEFFDYNCSACKFMFKPLDALRASGMKDVRYIFVEYPIFGEQSQKLARIALAVNALAPAKYYDFHGKMMQHKGTIDADIAYGYAEAVGVKRAELEKELEKATYEEILKDNAVLGEALNIRGTPFLIVGDEPVPHALDEKGLNEYIAKAKAK
jgi:protein-disulfide isomerase